MIGFDDASLRMRAGGRLAPAKLNLTLEVTGRRPDGLHTLRSVVVPVAIFDELRWTPAPVFRFTCSRGDLAHDDNLVVRAARAIGIDSLGIALHLEKRIPAGAGLGGGSSDAAALLLAAAEGAFGSPPPRNMLAVARELGSDVPLFLARTAALIEATGERVTPLGATPRFWSVVAHPGAAMNTARAYALLDAAPRPRGSRSASASLRMVEALQRADFDGVAAALSNDFHEIVAGELPGVAELLAEFERGGRRALLTGSGSAVFALFRDEAAAIACASALEPLLARLAGAVFVAPFTQTPDWRVERPAS